MKPLRTLRDAWRYNMSFPRVREDTQVAVLFAAIGIVSAPFLIASKNNIVEAPATQTVRDLHCGDRTFGHAWINDTTYVSCAKPR